MNDSTISHDFRIDTALLSAEQVLTDALRDGSTYDFGTGVLKSFLKTLAQSRQLTDEQRAKLSNCLLLWVQLPR
jgi:hypothetical protein